MSSITNHLPDFSSFNPLTVNGEASRKTQSSSATLQVQQNSDITLFTEEGDKVTISSASRFEANYATYSSQGVIGGNAFQINAEAYSVSEAFVFKFSVEGNLNKEELKDITKAMQTIEKLTTDFFSGKTDKALDRATRITNLDSIARFEAVLQYSKSLSAETAVIQTAPAQPESSPQTPPIATSVASPEVLPLPEVLPQVEATDEAPPTLGPILSKLQSDEDSAQTAAASLLPPSTAGAGQVNALVEQMVDAVLASRIAPSKIVDRLEDFLNSLFVKLARGDRMDFQELQMTKQIQGEFSFSMTEVAQAEGEASEQAPELENHEASHSQS